MKVTAEVHKIFGLGIAGAWDPDADKGVVIILGPLVIVIERSGS